jgi:hypothetical protein
LPEQGKRGQQIPLRRIKCKARTEQAERPTFSTSHQAATLLATEVSRRTYRPMGGEAAVNGATSRGRIIARIHRPSQETHAADPSWYGRCMPGSPRRLRAQERHWPPQELALFRVVPYPPEKICAARVLCVRCSSPALLPNRRPGNRGRRLSLSGGGGPPRSNAHGPLRRQHEPARRDCGGWNRFI